MKINVLSIISDHIKTLYDTRTNRISLTDILTFYLFPAICGIIALLFKFRIPIEGYSISITFFGIFIALLLNIQVAIFSIFQRKWIVPEDDRQAQILDAEMERRKSLLGELNTNISYLIIISCFSLFAFLAFYVSCAETGVWPAISVVLYIHFILSFLMVAKRSHALFQKEYTDEQ